MTIHQIFAIALIVLSVVCLALSIFYFLGKGNVNAATKKYRNLTDEQKKKIDKKMLYRHQAITYLLLAALCIWQAFYFFLNWKNTYMQIALLCVILCFYYYSGSNIDKKIDEQLTNNKDDENKKVEIVDADEKDIKEIK